MLKIVRVSDNCHTVTRGGTFLCSVVEGDDCCRLEYMGELISYTTLNKEEVQQIIDYMWNLDGSDATIEKN